MASKDVYSLKSLSTEWETAHRELLQNVKQQPFVSEYEGSAHAILNGHRAYLPAYVPYVGHNYFEYRPRVLCYAINQNLSPHVRWTKEWVNEWARDVGRARDRLNCAAREGRAIPIRPYAEGFIPLVALMAIRCWVQTNGGYLPRKIEDVLAVTNFVKFSTAKDASSSSIPAVWWKECGSRYVRHEIAILRPDIIIGFGQKTVTEIRRVLSSPGLPNGGAELLGCRFPARISSIKARPLSEEESKIWKRDILALAMRMRKPKENSYHKWKIQNYPGYFIDVVNAWNFDP